MLYYLGKKEGDEFMDKLSREEVEHVAHLARIGLDENDIEKYQLHLKKLIDDIDKIKDIENYDEEFLITPVDHKCDLRDDEVGNMLDYKEVMKNVPNSNGNFVEVPVMINE